MRGLYFTCTLLLLSTSAPSLAQGLVWLGPSGVVSPDGFEIAVASRSQNGFAPAPDAQLTAKGAQLKAREHKALGKSYFVLPDPGVREVALNATASGKTLEGTWTVGPPASRVELGLTPALPVKGRDKEATVTIRLLKPDGSVDTLSSPPAVQANVGQLETITEVEPGVYKARYVLPDTGYPEVVVIVAFAPWPQPSSVHGAFGALRIPLATAFPLQGVAEKNSQTTLEIAGQKFGPVQTSADGTFTVDVVVPPGYRFAKGLTVDRAGNKRTTTLDLALPPTDQLACVMNPRSLPADGVSRARILCAVSDPYGKAIPNPKVQLQTKRGTLAGPKTVGGDLLEWIYVAPKPPSLEAEVLAAQWKAAGPLSKEELEVKLQQGPAATVDVDAEQPVVHKGGQVKLQLNAKDSFGRPRQGASVQSTATVGTLKDLGESKPGEHELVLELAADAQGPKVDVVSRAVGPAGKEPVALRAWKDGDKLFVGVADITGAPVANQELDVAGLIVATAADGVVATKLPANGEYVDVRHKRWTGLTLRVYGLPGGDVFPVTPIIGSQPKKTELKVGPQLPVNVRMTVRGREVTYWVEDPKGTILPGRKVKIALSGGTKSGDQADKSGKRTFTVQAATPISVSVADEQFGVTAVAEVRP